MSQITIVLARTESEWNACYPVVQELRPHLTREEFLRRVRLQWGEGYRLAYIAKADKPVAVAGFRICHNLAWGRFLYVDDLVTAADCRSKGYGAALLDWLRRVATEEGCHEIHLDSGVQRKDAHRFYERERLSITSYHFSRRLRQ